MTVSSKVGSRFEEATLQLFTRLLPQLGFNLISCERRRSGSQKGFDICFRITPAGASDVNVSFLVECKGAQSVNQLPLEEFEGKPEQLENSYYNPDYWVLFSPLRYLGNDFQEFLQHWKRRQYPFAFINWAREDSEKESAGLYLDLFKHFPDIYHIFKEDVPKNIRDTAPEYSLEDILEHLKKSIETSYDEFQERVVFKGLLRGVRRITPQSIYGSREIDFARLIRIRNGYYMLNSSDRFVWKVVCNDLDVRNGELTAEIRTAVDDTKHMTAIIWVLGSPGCGKTTQMNRTAVDYALGGYPVILINTLDLDKNTEPTDYEEYLRLVYYLHRNAETDPKSAKPLLVFIDNPAARIEDISRILRRFDDYDETFKCVFVLFEREVRYHQAEDESFLVELIGSNTAKIYIDNQNPHFKEKVFQSFAQALDLSIADHDLARASFLDSPQISVAESVINFCKKTQNNEYKHMIMDWLDFEDVAREQHWFSLADTYNWVSTLYQFGIAIPTSILTKAMPGLDKSEFYRFQDFFSNEEYENLPIILEGSTLRARHELIAQWNVERLSSTIRQRLRDILGVIELDDSLERSVFTSLLGRKNIVRRYFADLNQTELAALQQKAASHPLADRMVLMMIGWIQYARNEYTNARDTFKSILEESPSFLPALLEAGKTEFLLGNNTEAERLLNRCIAVSPKDLNSRTELARVYQAEKKYDEAEELLKECIEISPQDLNSRTELARIYRTQNNYDEAKKMLDDLLKIDAANLQARTELARIHRIQNNFDEAEKVLNECIKLSPKDLDSRTELAKVFQLQKRYSEAESVLKKCIDISPRDLNSRTELAKVYQAQERYDEAERVLKELLELDSKNLQARTELAKVYQVQGRYDEAEKRLKEYLELDPKGLQPRTELAKVYQVQGRYDEAERLLKESLEIDSKQLHPRTELAKVYQVQERYDEAERVLKELLELDSKNLQARTELAKVYQVQGRYDEAEEILKEEIHLAPSALHPRTEQARVYIKLGLFRRARAEVLSFLQENPEINPDKVAHLMLTFMNACYQMRRYQEGIKLIDKYGCQFVSPQLAEEYGRLLSRYDLSNAVIFFRTASRIFPKASRLLSEAAVCFQLAGRPDAEKFLERAIELDKNKEAKYRGLFDNARPSFRWEFKEKDFTGGIVSIDHQTAIIENSGVTYSFRSNKFTEQIFSRLKITDTVFFDVDGRGFAVNVEPYFELPVGWTIT